MAARRSRHDRPTSCSPGSVSYHRTLSGTIAPAHHVESLPEGGFGGGIHLLNVVYGHKDRAFASGSLSPSVG